MNLAVHCYTDSATLVKYLASFNFDHGGFGSLTSTPSRPFRLVGDVDVVAAAAAVTAFLFLWVGARVVLPECCVF
jgi:hypothetical protein